MDENFIKRRWRPPKGHPYKKEKLVIDLIFTLRYLRYVVHMERSQNRHQGRLGDAVPDPRPILQVRQTVPRAQSKTIVAIEEDQQ